MSMSSSSRKKIIFGLLGFLYAVVYGFWTMMATGGGHGNFIWFLLFLMPGIFGLYFPLMAALAVELRERFIRMIFAGLLGFNLVTSIVMIVGWITESPTDGRSDFERTVGSLGYGGILFCGAIHFLPTFVFLVLLGRALTGGGSPADDDGLTQIQLS